MSGTRRWEVIDEFWEPIRPLIPSTPSHAKGGIKRVRRLGMLEIFIG